METRRIRRLARRRRRRTALLAASVVVIGIGVGMSLPHDHTATIVLLVASVACLVLVGGRDESVAPLHGLRRVVRLPLRAAIGATLASFRARLGGSLRAVGAKLRPEPPPLVLDEPDEESAAWWGVPPASRPDRRADAGAA
jgi:hypothetical protein